MKYIALIFFLLLFLLIFINSYTAQFSKIYIEKNLIEGWKLIGRVNLSEGVITTISKELK